MKQKQTTNKNNIQRTMMILEYKLLFQEKEKVNLEFEEGSIDLNYRLSFFQDKINKTSQEKISLFNNNSPQSSKSKISDTNVTTIAENNLNKNEETNPIESQFVDHPEEIKRLYRKIITITHPDKTSGINSRQIIQNYTEYYHMAVRSYEQKKYEDILMVSNDLMIDLSDISDELFEDTFKTSLIEIKRDINEKKKTVGYHWYHVPDDKKDYHLKLILANLGFSYTEEKVEEAIKSKYMSARKKGERPGLGILSRKK